MKRSIEEVLLRAATDAAAHEQILGRPNLIGEKNRAQMRVWLFPWGTSHVAIMLESGARPNRTIFRGEDPGFILKSMSDKYSTFLEESGHEPPMG